MRQARHSVLAAAAMAGFVSLSVAGGQAPTLQEQLSAQYKPVKMGSDSGGVAVVEPGTLLAVQRGGVLSVPWKALALCPAKFQDNSLHPSAGFCAGMVKSVSKYYQKGDKVYPVKIDVNLDKAKISFTVVACDSCNGVNPPTSMKVRLSSSLPKGIWRKPAPEKLKTPLVRCSRSATTISRPRAETPTHNRVNRKPRHQSLQQAEPQTVQLGMTTDRCSRH